MGTTLGPFFAQTAWVPHQPIIFSILPTTATAAIANRNNHHCHYSIPGYQNINTTIQTQQTKT